MASVRKVWSRLAVQVDRLSHRWEGQLMMMHTAVELNQVIRERSSEAQIVIVNFPAPPSKLSAEENCFLLRHQIKLFV